MPLFRANRQSRVQMGKLNRFQVLRDANVHLVHSSFHKAARGGKKLACRCTARSRAGPRIKDSNNNAFCFHLGRPHLLARHWHWAGPGAKVKSQHHKKIRPSPLPPSASLTFLEGATTCQDGAKRPTHDMLKKQGRY